MKKKYSDSIRNTSFMFPVQKRDGANALAQRRLSLTQESCGQIKRHNMSILIRSVQAVSVPYLGGDSKDLENEGQLAAPSNFFRTSSTFDQPASTLSRRFSGVACDACLASSSLVRLTETSGMVSRGRRPRASWHLSMNCCRRSEKFTDW